MTEIRFIEPSELEAYYQAIGFGFGADPSTDAAALERFAAINPVETSIAAFDRGRMVATFGSYDLDLTLPGGATVPMAGTTHVTVHPTHRRQGILSGMMRLHLEQAVDRGQPVAGLWASEERIYGRFGYGPAAFGQTIEIPEYTVEGAPADPTVSVHPLTVDEAAKVLPDLYEQRRASIAGTLVRTEAWWCNRVFPDPAERRGRNGMRRFVVAERDGAAVGYLTFRLRELDGWAEGRTSIGELVALDDDARRALWHFVTNVDLYRQVAWFNASMDDPLLIESDRFRQVKRSVMDSIWLRPLDVARLLEARTYEADDRLVLGLTDRVGPTAGRYRLEVADGVARVEASGGAEPDVELAVEDLGRLILGGTSAVTLGRAGLVRGARAAIDRLHDLFVTRNQPHCPEVF